MICQLLIPVNKLKSLAVVLGIRFLEQLTVPPEAQCIQPDYCHTGNSSDPDPRSVGPREEGAVKNGSGVAWCHMNLPKEEMREGEGREGDKERVPLL